jgi:hypothetical protein
MDGGSRLIQAVRGEVMSIAESDNLYTGIVVVLNSGWRVIECRHGVQWVLQHRNRAVTVARHVWRSRSCCRTKAVLIRCCDEHAGQIDPAARMTLVALPDRINSEGQNATQIEVPS